MVGINVPIPVPVAYYSFGGWKASLFGDTHIYGPEGIHFYTRGKVVTTRWPDPATSQGRPRLPADPLGGTRLDRAARAGLLARTARVGARRGRPAALRRRGSGRRQDCTRPGFHRGQAGASRLVREPDDGDAARSFLDVGIELDGEPRSCRCGSVAGAPADTAARARRRALGRPGHARRPAGAGPPRRHHGALVLATSATTRLPGDHPFRVVLGELRRPAGSRGCPFPGSRSKRCWSSRSRTARTAWRSTGSAAGNPFFLAEVLANPGETVPPRRWPTRCWRAPRGLDPRRAAAARGRLRSMPARAELWLLEAVAAGRRSSSLDACLASGVLRADGDGVAFRHELARLAVESAVAAAPAPALHAAILARSRRHAADALAAGAPRRGGRRRRGRAASTRRGRAPGAAAAGAHREAAAQYARALRHAAALPHGRARARCSPRTPRRRSVTAATQAAIDGAQRGDRAATASSATGCATGDRARAAHRPRTSPLGRNAEAEAASLRAIELLERLPAGPELARGLRQRRPTLRMLSRDNADGGRLGRARAGSSPRASATTRRWRWRSTCIGTSHADGGRDRPRCRVPAARASSSRARRTTSSVRIALGASECSAPGSARCTSSSAPQRYLEEQHRVRRGARASTRQLRERVARGRASCTAAGGRDARR